MQHKKIKHYWDVVTKSKMIKPSLIFLAIVGVFSTTSAFATADELSGVMDSVQANFGSGSAFIKLLYAAEIIAGGYAWHQTKHPKSVLGIVILALFMTYALSHWVFK